MGAIGPGRGRRRFCRRRSTGRPSRASALGGAGELRAGGALPKLDIGFCVGCNRCLAQTSCTLADDMNDLYEKLRDADVVLLASPDYFGTVSARMKNFMDRTRPFHMVENVLTGKVGGAHVHGRAQQLRRGGDARCFWTAGSPPRACSPCTRAPRARRWSGGVVATGFAGLERDRASLRWRSVKGDEIGFALARQLGREAVVPGRAAGGSDSFTRRRADKTVVKCDGIVDRVSEFLHRSRAEPASALLTGCCPRHGALKSSLSGNRSSHLGGPSSSAGWSFKRLPVPFRWRVRRRLIMTRASDFVPLNGISRRTFCKGAAVLGIWEDSPASAWPAAPPHRAERLASSAPWKAGTYTAEVTGRNAPYAMTVTFTDDAIGCTNIKPCAQGEGMALALGAGAERDVLCKNIFAQPDGTYWIVVNTLRYPDPDEPDANGATINNMLALGHIVAGDTVEALAGEMGVDAANLQASIDAYNAVVEGGTEASSASWPTTPPMRP